MALKTLSPGVLARLEALDLVTRQVIIDMASPDARSPISDQACRLVFSLLDSKILTISHLGTPDVHLHTPHPANEHDIWCDRCAALEKRGK